jgi:hypothetical protein
MANCQLVVVTISVAICFAAWGVSNAFAVRLRRRGGASS